ncbi:fatty acid--CoA ligase family protein [Sediminibacillus albus]|uniref:Long-chain acyl-CoA synthetase n=1 Tax=Sediminibacillus albus TaxID=407036 RepID=A0A1G8XCK1_9BACI|nr:fatty acid--CoA ligase family protein [Sediminibacillus albus]SDJ88223.1 long-chain acyl-CoA synthetase [Sediminibacillus albus]
MNLSDQISVTAQQHPEKTAYIFEGKDTTYQQLESSISRFADSLQQMGYQKGDHLALAVGNSPYFIIGMYGALRAGITVIPINPIYTPDEMAYILQDGDVKGIITMDVLAAKFEAISDVLTDVRHVIIAETGEAVSQSAGDFLLKRMKPFAKMIEEGSSVFSRPQLKENDTALVLYTSGTTGKPKGAMLTHKNLYSNAKDVADYLEMDGKDKVIAALPMFHVFCLTVALNAPLMNGGSVLIVPKFSPEAVFKIARKHGATVFAGVPTMYNYLLQTPGSHKEDFQTIRLCISGGAAMPVALLKNFEQKFQVMVSEGYGLSEASPVTCFNPLDRERKPGSIGTNIKNVVNKVVDEFGEELPAGEVGELVVKGPNVMAGYYKMPEETEAILKDGWLYTGDMARMDEDGYFYIVDRRKDMIIVGGYNVYPREVEEVLYEHPEIAEVAVVGMPDRDTGEAVICFVVSENPSLSEEDVISFCQERLAKYKVPVALEFLAELPKNTTGKILRKQLREQVAPSRQ